MTDTEAYRATLARLETDLQKAERHADNLRAGISAIQAILGEGAPVVKAVKAAAPRIPAEIVTNATPSQGSMTMKDWAVFVLRQAKGRPMRVREIYDTMMALGFRYDRGYDVFRSSLAPTLERSGAFRKVDKGLYTLREFADTPNPQGLLAALEG